MIIVSSLYSLQLRKDFIRLLLSETGVGGGAPVVLSAMQVEYGGIRMNRRVSRIGSMFKRPSCSGAFPVLVRITSISSILVGAKL